MTKKSFLTVTVLMILSALPGCSQNRAGDPQNRAGDPQNCAELDKLIDITYGFKPSKLTSAEQSARSAQMDAFWNKVKAGAGISRAIEAGFERKGKLNQ